jgi:hypothetical protein
MLSKEVTETDAFLGLPFSAQVLYLHYCMNADDDGVVSNPLTLRRLTGCSGEDENILARMHFVIPFKSGVMVIKHWKIHNKIPKDRYHPTKYVDEIALLQLKPNDAYTLIPEGEQFVYSSYTDCIQDVSKLDTEVRLGKVSIGKYRKDTIADKVGECVPSRSGIEAEFEELWKLYPRKEGRKKALDAYRRAKKKGTTFEEVKAGILNYREYIEKENIEMQYIAYGSTWFNGERWHDEYVSTRQPTTMDLVGKIDLSDWGVTYD